MCKINGVKLSEMREKAGMSQNALAKKLGVAESTISNYETGRSNPPEDKVEKLCFILKINKDDIEIHDVGYSFSESVSKTVKQYRQRKDFQRLMVPGELEAWIQEKKTISDEKEKATLKNKLRSAVTLGYKKFITIDPTCIHIPVWQRDTDMTKVMEIKTNFTESKFDPIKGFLYGDKLWVADGAHRNAAIALLNSESGEEDQREILVEIIDCTMHEAIMTFLGQQSGRKGMSTNDMYRAGVKANVEEYLNFKEIFDESNIQITAETERKENPIGRIRPSRELLRMSKSKQAALRRAISMIIELNWCGSTEKNAFNTRNIKVLLRMEGIHGDATLDLLKKHCNGAAYYESKVFPIKSQAQLFDVLESEINK